MPVDDWTSIKYADGCEEGYVADAGHYENFDTCIYRFGTLIPEGNQSVGAEPHHFPENEHLKQVI